MREYHIHFLPGVRDVGLVAATAFHWCKGRGVNTRSICSNAPKLPKASSCQTLSTNSLSLIRMWPSQMPTQSPPPDAGHLRLHK